MEKLLQSIVPLTVAWAGESQNVQNHNIGLSYGLNISNSASSDMSLVDGEVLSSEGQGVQGISFNPWMIIICVFILHVFRQFYYYYKFFTSEHMAPMYQFLNFRKHILPSFIMSILTGVRSMNYSHLVGNISANAALRKIHMLPYRSKFHVYYTDVQAYKGTSFVIAMDTDEKILAFRRVMMKFISERLSSGLLQKTIKEGVEQWAQKGTVDMLDIVMFLENVAMKFLYDIDPNTVYTPEERKKRAQTIYDGTKWVLYDAYRPMGDIFSSIFIATGLDLDPMRRAILKQITEIWEDVYERQIEMMQNGQDCLLGAFFREPLLANQDLNFLKANTIGAILGGQFLTSLSNITGMFYNVSKGQIPQSNEKVSWILQVISDWSPLVNILRSYGGFVVNIPSTGNAKELHRSFSLGPRQCPGKGMVLELYGSLMESLSQYKVEVERLEDTKIRCSLWPFTNPNLRFKIEKQPQPQQQM